MPPCSQSLTVGRLQRQRQQHPARQIHSMLGLVRLAGGDQSVIRFST
jgi:hypothetical protein